MPAFSARTSFDPDNIPDEVSLMMSLEEGAESTASHTSSIYTSNGEQTSEEIVELIRGQCLVIYTPKGRGQEVVCAGKYDQCRVFFALVWFHILKPCHPKSKYT